MSKALRLDLDGFEVESLAPSGDQGTFTLESLTRGHGMAETTASVVGGCSIFLCSCCCCC